MRPLITGLCIVMFGVLGPLSKAQLPPEGSQFVAEPSENALLVIASQPDCPLSIENGRRFLNINKLSDVRYAYEIRNRGIKPISDFTMVAWTSFGTGGTLIPKWKFSKASLMPGETIMSNGLSGDDAILPLTGALRERLKLHAPMKAIIVLMVEKVEFSDGSVFNDQKTSNSLLHYFENLDVRTNVTK